MDVYTNDIDFKIEPTNKIECKPDICLFCLKTTSSLSSINISDDEIICLKCGKKLKL